jgi:hypothetical protein
MDFSQLLQCVKAEGPGRTESLKRASKEELQREDDGRFGRDGWAGATAVNTCCFQAVDITGLPRPVYPVLIRQTALFFYDGRLVLL